MEPQQHITDHEHLRTVYRDPGQPVIDKVIHHVDAGAADFIAHSPFVVVSTANEARADASPRGGPPGFVRVLNQHRLAWGDLTGNNRLDSFRNLIDQPNIGLLFLVPGIDETLRVTGAASLVRDAAVLEACAIGDRLPKAAVVVTVRECYIQCGAALRRSALWDPATWPSAETRPSPAAILKRHMGSTRSADDIEASLDHYYEHYIWVPGGRQD